MNRPKFQQRHYEILARWLRDYNPAERHEFECLVESLAQVLARDNGNFQRTRFLRAAGVLEE